MIAFLVLWEQWFCLREQARTDVDTESQTNAIVLKVYT